MIFLLLRWVLNAVLLLLLARFLSGFEVGSFYTALMTALIMGIVNTLIRPLILLLTFPLTILTLGLFIFVVNGLMLWFVASFVKGFSIDSFTTALVAAFLLWAVNFLVNAFTNGLFERRVLQR
jgi:putative membrane protein